LEDNPFMTRSGAMLGTPAYMAPEQAGQRRAAVSPASDVYSLGSILYHSLTGQAPFRARTSMDLLMMLLEQDPTPLRLLNPRVHHDLEMITLRCLQKPPELRYPSASALADDLNAFLRDEPVAARSGRFSHVIARLFRETHHATILENWGLIWMWHSLALLAVSLLTNLMAVWGVTSRWSFFMLWASGMGTWGFVFWRLRRRQGPVTFVERQIAHIWAAGLIMILMLIPLEALIGMPPLRLSPLIGGCLGMVFLVKAGILSGSFYLQAVAMFAAGFGMAAWPEIAHTIFGITAALSFFLPGLKYYRQRLQREREESLAANDR
jgi:serine/threonine-protein kinase